MSASRRRVELAPLYVLHHRPWRDTSRMLEVFTREHGRLTLFARGVRGPKSRTASLLQPFRRLLGSWSGSGDAGQLTQAEREPEDTLPELPAAAMMSAWYLNELLLKLTVRLDPQPLVFDLYDRTLAQLRTAASIEASLRGFERQLLELLGYGIEFEQVAREGGALQSGAYYHFHPDLGFVQVTGETGGKVFEGRVLLAIAADDYTDETVLEPAKRILRMALDHALDGRELRTRTVARAVARRSKED
jgi:DNA repair protein RecO (recombination protein O)